MALGMRWGGGRGEDAAVHLGASVLQWPDVPPPPSLRTSCYEGHGFLTSPQLSCQHPSRLRFNEEKTIISLVSVRSSWTLAPHPYVWSGWGVKGRVATEAQTAGLPDGGATRAGVETNYCHLLWLQTEGTSDLWSADPTRPQPSLLL